MIKVSNADGNGAIRYEQMTAEEQAAGLVVATERTMAVDWGDRRDPSIKRNRWGIYIMLPAENRDAADVTAFEAAVGWVEP